MSRPPSPATITLMEKVAADNGFDLSLPREGDWLGFASSLVPLRIWLTAIGDASFLAAFSQNNVARALADHGSAFTNPLPNGACAARGVVDFPSLFRMARRAFQLSKSLPDEPLRLFEKKTAEMPRSTEAERLVVQRVGQDVFRDGLLDYWEGRCAVTGLAIPELLRASHIKPWADCETDADRLDVHNGLLLAPHLDAAFDRGFITIADDGAIVVSPALTAANRDILGLGSRLCVRVLADGHRLFLRWHRERIFRK